MTRRRKTNRKKDQSETMMSIRGFVRALATDVRTGKVVSDQTFHNIVTSNGRDEIIRMISSFQTPGNTKQISFLGLGTGTTTASSNDTILGASTSPRAALITATLLSPGTVQYTASFAATDVNAALCEVGLFNSSSGGTLFAHANFGTINKTTDMTLAFTYQLNFQTA